MSLLIKNALCVCFIPIKKLWLSVLTTKATKHKLYILMFRMFIVFSLISSIAWGADNDFWSTLPDDVFIAITPDVLYPDDIKITDFSGTIIATVQGGGSYTFRISEDCTEEVNLSMTITATYQRFGKKEVITNTITGKKVIITNWPKSKRKKVTTETYSGSITRTFTAEAIPYISWSKKQQLASFPLIIGVNPDTNSPQNGVTIPIQNHWEIVTSENGKSTKEIYDLDFFNIALSFPNYGLSDSRWARINNNSDYAGMGWIETHSSQGMTSGSITKPVFMNSFLWATEKYFKQLGKNPYSTPKNKDSILWKGKLNITWALGGKTPKARLTISPTDKKDYEDWIPIPDNVDDLFGDSESIYFTAKIEPKEEGKIEPKGIIHFWLCDVSQEKGECTNFPLFGDNEDDLRFVPGPGLVIDPQNPRHAYTKSPCYEAIVEVEATDTGAYGVLQATCEELSLIAENELTNTHYISIPMDNNNNHIADAWEEKLGIYSSSNTALDDFDNIPSGQRRNGDGYTLYEEYRGFVTLDGYCRTNPLEKDLFIYDQDRLIKDYYEPLNPAELKLHYINPDLMRFSKSVTHKEHRWVNFNSNELMHAKQYAMHVIKWDTTLTKEIGNLPGGKVCWEEFVNNGTITDIQAWNQPLRYFYLIKINVDGTHLKNSLRTHLVPDVRSKIFELYLRRTIIHEFGHAIGIRHHLKDLRAEKEDEEEKVSGVSDCAMREPSAIEKARPELYKPSFRYCRKGETYIKEIVKKEIDDEGNERVVSVDLVTMPAHGCFEQIDIKSD